MDKTNLKRGIWFSVVILLIFLEVSSTKAIHYEIKYHCEKDQCVEGEIAKWDISITNYGEKKIEIISIELIDSINKSLIAFFNTTYDPLSHDRGNLFVIQNKNQKTKTIYGKIPKANNNTNLIYHPCFANTIDDPHYTKNDIYSLRYCYDEKKEVMPILECVLNSSCSNNEYCKNNKCIKLKCKNCQYAHSHKCIDYECCSNNSCKEDELCKNNKCTKLNCSEQEYLLNHSCRFLNCSNDEVAFNHSCKMLNCSKDEFAFNHSYKMLNCSKDELIFNHSCIKLNCSEDEFIFDDTCKKLNCMFNETATNHTCNPLNCYFFQKKVNHRCLNDKQLIFKLSIELIIILIIISLLIVDIRRYKSKIKEGKSEKNINKKILKKQ